VNTDQLMADFGIFADHSESGKPGKRHTKHSNSKPRNEQSDKEVCVLMTADERTTGINYQLFLLKCFLLHDVFAFDVVMITHDCGVTFTVVTCPGLASICSLAFC